MATPATTNTADAMSTLLVEHGLPASYRLAIDSVVRPLASGIVNWHSVANRPLLVALNGAQGTGKSTLASFLQSLLEDQHQRRCVVLSLDDLYLTLQQRATLADQVHPLLRTRGVPGTHDLALGNSVLNQLVNEPAGTPVALPRFDKASDDRVDPAYWHTVTAQPDVIIVEGWCMGAPPERDHRRLAQPINPLEQDEDSDQRWRQYVNQCLRFEYASFFQRFERLIMLKAPCFDCVKTWRTLQEHKLADRLTSAPNQCTAAHPANRIMDDAALSRFLMHYERLTLAMLDTLPARADAVIPVDEQHRMQPIHWQEGRAP